MNTHTDTANIIQKFAADAYKDTANIIQTFAASYKDIEDKKGFIEMCIAELDENDFIEDAKTEIARLAELFVFRIVDDEYLTEDGELTHESSCSTDSEEDFEQNFSMNYSLYNNTYLANDF